MHELVHHSPVPGEEWPSRVKSKYSSAQHIKKAWNNKDPLRKAVFRSWIPQQLLRTLKPYGQVQR